MLWGCMGFWCLYWGLCVVIYFFELEGGYDGDNDVYEIDVEFIFVG